MNSRETTNVQWAQRQLRAVSREMTSLDRSKASFFDHALKKCHCWVMKTLDTGINMTELKFMYQGSKFRIIYGSRVDAVWITMLDVHAVSDDERVDVMKMNELVRLYNKHCEQYRFEVFPISSMVGAAESKVFHVARCTFVVGFDYFIEECDQGLYDILQDLFHMKINFKAQMLSSDE